MTARMKAISSALPLLAVVAIALVYVRAWAIFRQYDTDWLTMLSAADVFAMGWAMTPSMLIATAVGLVTGRSAGERTTPKPLQGWKVTLFLTSALLIALSYGIMMTSLGAHLSGRLLSFYPIVVLWLVVLHSHAAFRVTTTLSSFSRVAGLGAAAAMLGFWDWEGAAKSQRPTLKRITLEDGTELCSALIFSGRDSMFLWNPGAGTSVSLERRLVASVTKEKDCAKSAQNQQVDDKPSGSDATAEIAGSPRPARPVAGA